MDNERERIVCALFMILARYQRDIFRQDVIYFEVGDKNGEDF